MRTKLCVLFFFARALVPIGDYSVVIAARRTRVTRLVCGFSVEDLPCPSEGRGLRGRAVRECERVVRE